LLIKQVESTIDIRKIAKKVKGRIDTKKVDWYGSREVKDQLLNPHIALVGIAKKVLYY